MTNKSILMGAIIFAGGLVVGGVSTYFGMKDKFEKAIHEETEELRAYYEQKNHTCKCKKTEATEDTEKKASEMKSSIDKNSLEKYTKLLNKTKYDQNRKGSVETESPAEEDTMEEIYTISPDDFIEMNGYDKVTLTYYSGDSTLTDEFEETVEIEDTIGMDNLDYFGKYEDGTLYVRNEKVSTDYEVIMDGRSFGDIANP